MATVRNSEVISDKFFFFHLISLTPQPPPQNPAEFLRGFSTILFLQGRVLIPTPNPHLGGSGLCIYIPQRQSKPVLVEIMRTNGPLNSIAMYI